MKFTTRRLALLAACSLLLGCEHSPAAPAAEPGEHSRFAAEPGGRAERTVYEAIFDLTDSYYLFRCSPDGEVGEDLEGELVRMEGQIYERFTLLQDAAGGYHTRWHTMLLDLRGFGEATGEEFRVFEQSQGGANQTQSGTSGTYRQVLKLVGKDTGRSFSAIYRGHYRLIWDEEIEKIVVQRDLERIECRL